MFTGANGHKPHVSAIGWGTVYVLYVGVRQVFLAMMLRIGLKDGQGSCEPRRHMVVYAQVFQSFQAVVICIAGIVFIAVTFHFLGHLVFCQQLTDGLYG